MSDAPDLSLETKTVMALLGSLMLRLIHKGVLDVQDLAVTFDGALGALEGLPQTDQTALLRKELERVAARIAAGVVG